MREFAASETRMNRQWVTVPPIFHAVEFTNWSKQLQDLMDPFAVEFMLSLATYLQSQNQKSAVGKEKLTGSSDKGLFRLLWLLSFHRYKLQYSLATVLFFDNVVALLLYIMTRTPTRFNTVNDLLHTQGVLINNFRVSRLNRLKDDSLLSFM